MAKSSKVMRGNALWAKLFEPDTKFDANGVYSISLVLPEVDASEMCEYLDGLVEAKFDDEVKAKPALKNQLSKNPPYSPVYDRETGDATGEIEFKFKLKAKVNTRDGRTFEQKVAVVDAKRTPMKDEIAVGNGSDVKVAFEPMPYMVAGTKMVGVSLRLKAVQVINLVEYGSPATSVFDEEDGFVAEASTPSNTVAEVFTDGDF